MFIAGKRKREQSTDDCSGNSKNDAGEPEDVITGDPVPEFHFDLDVNGVTYCFDIEAFAKWILTSGHNLFPITQIRRYTTIDMDSVRRPKNPMTNKPLTNKEILDFAEVLEEFWVLNPEKRPKIRAYYWLLFENTDNDTMREYPVQSVSNPYEMAKVLEESYSENLLDFFKEQNIPSDAPLSYYRLYSFWERPSRERGIFHTTRLENAGLSLKITRPVPSIPKSPEGKKLIIHTRVVYNPPVISIKVKYQKELDEFTMAFVEWIPRNVDAGILVTHAYGLGYKIEGPWPGSHEVFKDYRMLITYTVDARMPRDLDERFDNSATKISDASINPRMRIFNKLSSTILPYIPGGSHVFVRIIFIKK